MITEYPKVYDNKAKAMLNAIDFSDKDRDHFYYVIFNNSGKYLVDLMGIVHSDEKLIVTAYQGSIQ